MMANLSLITPPDNIASKTAGPSPQDHTTEYFSWTVNDKRVRVLRKNYIHHLNVQTRSIKTLLEDQVREFLTHWSAYRKDVEQIITLLKSNPEVEKMTKDEFHRISSEKIPELVKTGRQLMQNFEHRIQHIHETYCSSSTTVLEGYRAKLLEDFDAHHHSIINRLLQEESIHVNVLLLDARESSLQYTSELSTSAIDLYQILHDTYAETALNWASLHYAYLYHQFETEIQNIFTTHPETVRDKYQQLFNRNLKATIKTVGQLLELPIETLTLEGLESWKRDIYTCTERDTDLIHQYQIEIDQLKETTRSVGALCQSKWHAKLLQCDVSSRSASTVATRMHEFITRTDNSTIAAIHVQETVEILTQQSQRNFKMLQLLYAFLSCVLLIKKGANTSMNTINDRYQAMLSQFQTDHDAENQEFEDTVTQELEKMGRDLTETDISNRLNGIKVVLRHIEEASRFFQQKCQTHITAVEQEIQTVIRAYHSRICQFFDITDAKMSSEKAKTARSAKTRVTFLESRNPPAVGHPGETNVIEHKSTAALGLEDKSHPSHTIKTDKDSTYNASDASNEISTLKKKIEAFYDGAKLPINPAVAVVPAVQEKHHAHDVIKASNQVSTATILSLQEVTATIPDDVKDLLLHPALDVKDYSITKTQSSLDISPLPNSLFSKFRTHFQQAFIEDLEEWESGALFRTSTTCHHKMKLLANHRHRSLLLIQQREMEVTQLSKNRQDSLSQLRIQYEHEKKVILSKVRAAREDYIAGIQAVEEKAAQFARNTLEPLAEEMNAQKDKEKLQVVINNMESSVEAITKEIKQDIEKYGKAFLAAKEALAKGKESGDYDVSWQMILDNNPDELNDLDKVINAFNDRRNRILPGLLDKASKMRMEGAAQLADVAFLTAVERSIKDAVLKVKALDVLAKDKADKMAQHEVSLRKILRCVNWDSVLNFLDEMEIFERKVDDMAIFLDLIREDASVLNFHPSLRSHVKASRKILNDQNKRNQQHLSIINEIDIVDMRRYSKFDRKEILSRLHADLDKLESLPTFKGQGYIFNVNDHVSTCRVNIMKVARLYYLTKKEENRVARRANIPESYDVYIKNVNAQLDSIIDQSRKNADQHAKALKSLAAAFIEFLNGAIVNVLEELFADASIVLTKVWREETQMHVHQHQELTASRNQWTQRLKGYLSNSLWADELRNMNQNACNEAVRTIEDTNNFKAALTVKLNRILAKYADRNTQLGKTLFDRLNTMIMPEDIQIIAMESQKEVKSIRQAWEEAQKHIAETEESRRQDLESKIAASKRAASSASASKDNVTVIVSKPPSAKISKSKNKLNEELPPIAFSQKTEKPERIERSKSSAKLSTSGVSVSRESATMTIPELKIQESEETEKSKVEVKYRLTPVHTLIANKRSELFKKFSDLIKDLLNVLDVYTSKERGQDEEWTADWNSKVGGLF